MTPPEEAAKMKKREKRKRQKQRRKKRDREKKAIQAQLSAQAQVEVEQAENPNLPLDSHASGRNAEASEASGNALVMGEAVKVEPKGSETGQATTDTFKERREKKYKEFIEMRAKVRAMLKAKGLADKVKAAGKGDSGVDSSQKKDGDGGPQPDDGSGDHRSAEGRETVKINPLVPDTSVVGNPLIQGGAEGCRGGEEEEGGGASSDDASCETPENSESEPTTPVSPSKSPISKMRDRQKTMQRKMSNPLLGGKVSKRNSKMKRKSLDFIAAANEGEITTIIQSPLYSSLHDAG
ncbi:hypothetical protein HOP50_02g14470 [Chloropicon primus]|uniref:Uncharacterized protein n=1 Tax=Chloropicon primus TaxID=1764295 RepID=A0A5B8MF85_9CHLO|nr:hypothetical protein A3770_02p14590 [Chloropicon primus]UPQ98149.1 hypothetical protein HOP50_02g14470 [Chloropicon primus]|eukprot:QDZ18941.1 hypothetical protein A3770_02p14590 [Chloropicon primus]